MAKRLNRVNVVHLFAPAQAASTSNYTMPSLSPFYTFLISQSILLPFLVGLICIRRLGWTYRPFLILLILGALNEPVSYLFIEKIHSNAIPNNIYALVEWLLIAWQFRRWGFLRNQQKLYLGIVVLVSLVWVTEDLFLRQINTFPPYFQIFYCFLIVLLSVNKINFMITYDDRKLYSNPIFLICTGFIIFFIYRIVYEWAYQTSMRASTETAAFVIMLFGYVNALTNIIFAIALLCIPRPPRFSLTREATA
jgi:hypothetical protein